MITDMLENLQTLGPFFAAIWIVTILCAVLRPQRYLNSFMLMLALLVTVVFLSGFFGEGAGLFLLVCFLLLMLTLFLVPVLLILNGIQMIRRESFAPAHILSLTLGLIVGVGEIAAVVYVLDLSDLIRVGDAGLWVLLVFSTVFYFSFLVLSFVIYSVFIQIMPHRMNFDYVIIHGCGLADGERLTKLLSNRVDKAIAIYQKCRVKPMIIPSGGRGGDEKLSEAQAMTNYLMAHSIPGDHILMEDRSTTTRENLLNSKAIIEARDGRKRIALVSSNYHIYRCLLLARSVGLKCTGVGADVALYYWPSALIREFIAVAVTKRFLIWAVIGYLLFISPILYSLFT